MTDQNTSQRVSGTEEGADTGCACWSRRESLKAAGVAVAGAAGLGACGSKATRGSPRPRAPSSGAASAGSGSFAGRGNPGRRRQDPRRHQGGRHPADVEGEFKAFSAVCTHQQCTVSKASKDNVILCRCHLSEFDAATGAVRKGPATQPLPPKTVSVGVGRHHRHLSPPPRRRVKFMSGGRS